MRNIINIENIKKKKEKYQAQVNLYEVKKLDIQYI